VDDLAELLRLRQDLDDTLLLTVAALRDNNYTWAQIGAAMGVTRQAALMHTRRQ
jgi:hypothetical protein